MASATHDLGTGMYTILAQIAADGLGVDPRTIAVRIGDSLLPRAPVAGGSMSSASVGPAVLDGAGRLRHEAIGIAIAHGASPLHGLAAEAVEVRDGILRAKHDPARALTYAEVVRLAGTSSLEAVGSAAPGSETARLLAALVRRAVLRGALRRGAGPAARQRASSACSTAAGCSTTRPRARRCWAGSPGAWAWR